LALTYIFSKTLMHSALGSSSETIESNKKGLFKWPWGFPKKEPCYEEAQHYFGADAFDMDFFELLKEFGYKTKSKQ